MTPARSCTILWAVALLCSTANAFTLGSGGLVPPTSVSVGRWRGTSSNQLGPSRCPLHLSTATDADNAANNSKDAKNDQKCQVLILDHLNINHEKGRQDALKAFYFDFLGCAVDPRKYENYVAGKKTLWANIGMQQFHLPEGKPDAQVFDGMITLVHGDMEGLMEKYNNFLDGDEKFAPLEETEFLVGIADDMMLVTDPWGSQFCILPSDDPDEDRAAHIGAQPIVEEHGQSEGLALEDLTVFVEHGTNLEGIGRFYETVLGAPVIDELSSDDDQSICIAMGERQTLTFQYKYNPDGPEVKHHDFSYDNDDDADTSRPDYPSNHGPHISLYVTNLRQAYQAAEKLGVLYVNPRFSRRAYTEEEAVDQCMFRLIEIIDPEDEKKEVILFLEHEVRSTTTKDGKKYKSCPLLEI